MARRTRGGAGGHPSRDSAVPPSAPPCRARRIAGHGARAAKCARVDAGRFCARQRGQARAGGDREPLAASPPPRPRCRAQRPRHRRPGPPPPPVSRRAAPREPPLDARSALETSPPDDPRHTTRRCLCHPLFPLTPRPPPPLAGGPLRDCCRRQSPGAPGLRRAGGSGRRHHARCAPRRPCGDPGALSPAPRARSGHAAVSRQCEWERRGWARDAPALRTGGRAAPLDQRERPNGAGGGQVHRRADRCAALGLARPRHGVRSPPPPPVQRFLIRLAKCRFPQ